MTRTCGHNFTTHCSVCVKDVEYWVQQFGSISGCSRTRIFLFEPNSHVIPHLQTVVDMFANTTDGISIVQAAVADKYVSLMSWITAHSTRALLSYPRLLLI